MSLLVVGSVALDSVETPFGKVNDALGGSATYFSLAASYFTPVNLVAVVGKDFPARHVALLKKHDINTDGLQYAAGRTFRWKGHYLHDLDQAQTLDAQLNVFASFKPQIPAHYRDARYVFLGNIDPALQLEVLSQVKNPFLVGLDTMNFWIEGKRAALKKVLKKTHILLINEGEARQLSGQSNQVKASKLILAMGPKALVIKRGEYGALFFHKSGIFSAPALPLEIINDPTGAGDSFAGGFMGYLAGKGMVSVEELRRAIICGSVMASYNVESFSVKRLASLTKADILARYRQFKQLTHFDVLQS